MVVLNMQIYQGRMSKITPTKKHIHVTFLRYSWCSWLLKSFKQVKSDQIEQKIQRQTKTFEEGELVGGWTNPIKNILVKLDHFPR